MSNPFDEDPFAEPAQPVRSPLPSALAKIEEEETFFEPDLPAEPTEEPGTVHIPRGGPVGAAGRRSPIMPAPKLPAWEDPALQDASDGVDESFDYTDLAGINRDLQKLRVQMNRIRREMRRAGREAIEAKLTYQRQLRRALVQQTGGSAETRKASAELMCEELEADMVMKAQVADEFSTRFRSVRDDIENAKVVAYNLRAIHNMM